MTRLALSAAAFLILTASRARAHPEIEAALARLNTAIAAAPADAALYLERGELYAKHRDAIAAEANFLRAAELSPHVPRIDRARGALALDTHDFAAARRHLDRALERDPHDAEALVLRARVRAAQDDRAGARSDLDAALALVANPRPELFLERAALLPSPADAIRSLDAAIARIGPAHTLQLRALELEEAAGFTDAALARLAAIARASERPELWLKRRGDHLARAGRDLEARDAYDAALAAIAALPAWLRASPDTLKLASDLRQRCANLRPHS